jgi:hypothetical protein
MNVRTHTIIGVLVLVCVFLLSAGTVSAEKKMPDTVTLKLEGAKLAPVTFSHITHAEKAKINCAVCHHKDKDPKEAQACKTCHQVDGIKDNAPAAKDAFHKQCQTCHKENAAKGVKVPTKCAECHKK